MRNFDFFDLRFYFVSFWVPSHNQSIDRDKVIFRFVARSVILNTVPLRFLPLDIICLQVSQERSNFPEIPGVIALTNADGDLVKYFQHVGGVQIRNLNAAKCAYITYFAY